MRRMYSEKELSVLVYQAVGQYIEDGALDETIASAVDAYLVEHPVDITALEGQDIAPKDISATGNITAPSIIENMSGYSFTKQTPTKGTLTYVYAGAVKNGNKLTLVCAYTFNKNADATGSVTIGRFLIPSAVMSKIYPFVGANIVEIKQIEAFKDSVNYKTIKSSFYKYDAISLYCSIEDVSQLDAETDYYIRQEITLLLSDNLAE